MKKTPDLITFDPNFTWDIQGGESSTKLWESSVDGGFVMFSYVPLVVGEQAWSQVQTSGMTIHEDIFLEKCLRPKIWARRLDEPFAAEQHIYFYGMGLYNICMLLRCRCKSWISDVQKLKAWPILNYMHPAATKK